MDRRTLILLVATCGLLLVWHPLMKRVYPDKPLPATNRIASTTVVGGTNASAAVTAPITAPAPIAQLADDAWANDLQWNLSSVFFGTKHAFGHMLARGSGSVINISSVEGKTGAAGMAGYVAAKHGVHGLTKSAAAEAGRMGVTVNAICPGLIITDAVLQGGPGTAAAMGMSYEEMVEKVFKSKTLTGELNTVEQVAAVAVLLASETGRGITGSFFNVDGGQSPY